MNRNSFEQLNILELKDSTMQSSSPSPAPQSILVVDDEKDILALYKMFIKIIGCDIVCFTNPVLAFEHYKQFHGSYSLIITDLRMPGMSGIEFAKCIREMNSEIKIYLITAYDIADIDSQQACKEAKFNIILEKPVDFLKLQKIIEQDLSLNTN